ncbi:MFS transporter, partial [Streptococcus agalactiae]
GAEPKLAEHIEEPKKKISLSTFIEPGALPISLVTALIYFGYGTVLTYLNSYATELDLVKAAGAFFIVYAVVMFIIRPFTGRLFDERGDTVVMVPGYAAVAVALAVLAFASNSFTLLLSAALLGAGIGATQPAG